MQLSAFKASVLVKGSEMGLSLTLTHVGVDIRDKDIMVYLILKIQM